MQQLSLENREQQEEHHPLRVLSFDHGKVVILHTYIWFMEWHVLESIFFLQWPFAHKAQGTHSCTVQPLLPVEY